MMFDKKLLVAMMLFIPVGGCNQAAEEIVLSCTVTETVTEKSNGYISEPDIQPKTSVSYHFFKEKFVKDDEYVTDYRGSKTQFSGERKEDFDWVVERNGSKVIPKRFTSISNSTKLEISDYVVVGKTWLSVSQDNKNYEDGKLRSWNQFDVSINRITGALEGKKTDILLDIGFHNTMVGNCQKTERKF